MMDKPVVVIVGEMFGNKTIHGPFEGMDYLNQWVSQFVGNQRYEIVPIQDPEA